MEYTNDVILNSRYTNRIGTLKFKRKNMINSVFNIFKENKFISIMLISLSVLTVIDIILINTFMNLLITLN